jgi:hypothetical protein
MKLRSLLHAVGPALFRRPDLNNPPTSVGGIKETWFVLACRLDLNHPPTSVGGILGGSVFALGRLDLNHPPTSVGGILGGSVFALGRLDLNYPPTPVGGIPEFSQSLDSDWVSLTRLKVNRASE